MSKIKDTIANISSLFIQDIINLKHYKGNSGKKNKNAQELIETGYTKIDDFLSEIVCTKLYEQLISLSEKYKETTKLDTGTLISYRSDNTANGPDKGMIDISDINKTFEIDIDYKKVEEIIRATYGCDIYFTSVHAYINRGVEGTRIFHVDNCQPVVYKGFIYLTDVSSIEYGPYAFIKGTHRFSPQVYYNLMRNLFIKKYRSFDMPRQNKQKEIIGLGKKGTLIISNQNGIHRGYPQQKGKERVALVLNYMVASKLNYIHNTAKEAMDLALKKL